MQLDLLVQNLSPFQRLQIALSQAYIKDPKLLVINNITVGRSKRQINRLKTYVDLIRQKLNVTCLIITNTSRFAQNVDKIIFMENGDVAEAGSQLMLMSN